LAGRHSIEVSFPWEKSFLKWFIRSAQLESSSELIPSLIGPEVIQLVTSSETEEFNYLDPFMLTYEFLDILLLKVIGIPPKTDWLPLIERIISEVGFAVFHLKEIRTRVSFLSHTLYLKSSKDSLDKLVAALNVFLKSTRITEKRYWLFYVLAAISVQNKYVPSPTKAFLKVKQFLKKEGLQVSDGAVRREYYNKIKIVEQKKLILGDIIRQFGLDDAVNKFREAIEQEKSAG
jgi:hypothetical protein